MIKVLCTVVFILGSGVRQVERMDGSMVDEHEDYLIVDFGPEVPVEPQVRWVKENDCTYYEDPSIVYGDFLKLKELADREAAADKKKWADFVTKQKAKKK